MLYLIILFSAISISYSLKTIGFKKINFIRFILSVLLIIASMIIFDLIFSQFHIAFKFIINSLIFVLINKFIFKQSLPTAIISSFLTYCFLIVNELFLLVIFEKLIGIPVEELLDKNGLNFFLFNFAQFGLTLVIMFFIGNNFGRTINSSVNKKESIGWLIYILIFFIVIIINSNSYVQNKSEQMLISNLVIFSIFFSINFIFNKLFSEQNKKELELNFKEKELQNLMAYTTTIEKLLEENKVFRHRYNNILTTIGGFINEDDLKGLENYYNLIYSENSHIKEVKKIDLLDKFKDAGIKGLFIAKLIKLENNNIKSNIYINKNIDDLGKISNFDFINIIGILLDNAIEECETMGNDAQVLISVEDNKYGLIVTIANTFKTKPIISQIFKQGFSTKGDNRGIGLYDLSKIISKNSNIILNTQIKDEFFIQELNIKK